MKLEREVLLAKQDATVRYHTYDLPSIAVALRIHIAIFVWLVTLRRRRPLQVGILESSTRLLFWLRQLYQGTWQVPAAREKLWRIPHHLNRPDHLADAG